MTTENFLTVAGIIASLSIPFITFFLEVRWKRKSKQNGKKTRGTFFPGIRVFRLLNLLSFLFPSYILFHEITSAAPITRATIFIVSFAVASILYVLVMELFFMFTDLFRRLLHLHEDQIDFSNKLASKLEDVRSRPSKKTRHRPSRKR